MEADILDDEGGSPNRTLSFELDHTEGLSSHSSAQGEFDSDVERTLAQK
jgi:predicted nuclease of restriction endonuclease-like RecB superfamily